VRNDHENCGVTKTLKLIGSKWSLHIIHQLCNGKKRFGELQKALNGISPRTLSYRLKELEQEGLVNKKILPVVPLHVEYTLTPKGQALKGIFKKMEHWGNSA
jgi:DNA-binding HxlR family transcriptional regulator